MVYIWQENLWRELIGRKVSLPHAMLLHGQAGIGKRDFAETLAHALLCESPGADGMPCGHCVACGWLAAGTHPDFRVLQPDSEATAESADNEEAKEEKGKKPSILINVAQVRELIESVSTSASRGGMRVILICPAEAMNTAAANALLKTLEEPPLNTLLMLVSHHAQRLLPTVRSRCLKVAMPAPSVSQALGWLAGQEVAEPEICLAQAGFAPLRAIGLNDGDYREKRLTFLSRLEEAKNIDPFALAEAGEKLELAWTLNWLQTWIYDLISAQATGKVRYHLDFSAKIIALSGKIDILQLLGFQRDLLSAQRSLHHPLNVRLLLEQLLLSYWQIMNRKPESVRVG
jgi:DNA polymerase-3 subunit delta'